MEREILVRLRILLYLALFGFAFTYIAEGQSTQTRYAYRTQEGYVLVPPPLGAIVENLPAGYRYFNASGQKLYTFGGVYFLPFLERGRRHFRVVDNPKTIAGEILRLPDSTWPVHFNGHLYFVTADPSHGGAYYQKSVDSYGRKVFRKSDHLQGPMSSPSKDIESQIQNALTRCIKTLACSMYRIKSTERGSTLL